MCPLDGEPWVKAAQKRWVWKLHSRVRTGRVILDIWWGVRGKGQIFLLIAYHPAVPLPAVQFLSPMVIQLLNLLFHTSAQFHRSLTFPIQFSSWRSHEPSLVHSVHFLFSFVSVSYLSSSYAGTANFIYILIYQFKHHIIDIHNQNKVLNQEKSSLESFKECLKEILESIHHMNIENAE